MEAVLSAAELRRIPTVLGTIQVRISGSGPAMVCWPSLLMTGAMWQGQADAFGSSHRMILIDSPGHGGSSALTRHFSMEQCAECLAQVLDALGEKDCVLLGNSWGGMMGGVFAALYPQRLRAAVLMNCTAAAAPLGQKLEFMAMVQLLRVLPNVPQFMVARAVKAFAGQTTEATKPEVVARIREAVGAANPKSVAWAISSVVPRRRDHHALLARVQAPVLVMTGEEDRTFPVSETRRMVDAIPGARFAVLPKVGHLAALEAPEAVNRVIQDFLGPLGA